MKTKSISFSEAIREALIEEMDKDENVFLLGQDIKYSMFGITGGLDEMFSKERVLPAPISENGFCTAAVGAALTGKRPVLEIMYADFALLAMDAIGNQASKYRYMCGGDPWKVPVVYRIAGSGIGAGAGLHHSQYLESMFLHFPGLKVVSPSNPADAKGLLKSAIKDNNPVVFIEYKTLYSVVGEVPEGDDISEPLEEAKITQEGTDVTIISYGTGVDKVKEASEELQEKGVSVEIVDLRTIHPLDKKTIKTSIQKTGNVIIVEDCPKTMGVGAEVSAIIGEEIIEYMESPIQRVAGEDTCIPANKEFEEIVVPKVQDIVTAVGRCDINDS